MSRQPDPQPSDLAARAARLRHVYWVGGGSGAGKSTLARRLAAGHGLRLHVTDETMAEHARGSSPAECPWLHRFMGMDMDERWLNRPPWVMLETFHWFRGEAFDRIVGDLLRLPSRPPVVVEGFRLLPHLVAPLLTRREQALWLLPSPDFQEAVLEGRGGAGWAFLARTSDPGRARRNLLQRDRMFTVRLRRETARLGLAAFEVDARTSEDALARRAGRWFGL